MSTIYAFPPNLIFTNQAIGTIVCGSPGSGKTFFLVNLGLNCLSMGTRLIAIDPKDDFMKIKRIFNDVEVIDINKIRPGALNPFTFLDDFDANTLMTITELLCGKLDKKDNVVISPIVQDFVRDFKRDNNYRDMQEFADKLYGSEALEARNIGSILQRQAESQYGKLFFTRDLNVEPLMLPANKSFVITLNGMNLPDYKKSLDQYTADERFISAALYVIIKKLRSILTAKSKIPTTIFCDEAHMLYGNEEMTRTIDEFLVKGRSLNVAMVLASQGISHFPEDIANYCSNKFIFKSSLDEATEFVSRFDTSKYDVETQIDATGIVPAITKLNTGQCFFIDSKSRSGFVQIESNYDVSLLSSNPLSKANQGEQKA